MNSEFRVSEHNKRKTVEWWPQCERAQRPRAEYESVTDEKDSDATDDDTQEQ
jgi:hypothetical protein